MDNSHSLPLHLFDLFCVNVSETRGMNKMKTSLHTEPVGLIQCLDLKSGTLNGVIIEHMLWEIRNPPLLQHPDTKQGVGTEVTSSSVSGYCSRRIWKEIIYLIIWKQPCVLRRMSQLPNSSAAYSEVRESKNWFACYHSLLWPEHNTG